MIRYTPPVITGNGQAITTVNNLLEVNSNVLQFGGAAVKNTTGNLGSFELLFTSNNNTLFGSSDFAGTGRYFGAGLVDNGLGILSILYGGFDVTGAQNLWQSGSDAMAFGQEGFAGVRTDLSRSQMSAICNVTDLGSGNRTGWIATYNIGTVAEMQGFAGEVLTMLNSAGHAYITYANDTADLTIGHSTVDTSIIGKVGFFGATPVLQQTADDTSAAVTVADLVANLATWQTALINLGLITFV